MEVNLRKQHFDIKAAGLKPLDKIAFALVGNYTKYTKDNKGQPDPKGLGLAGLALQLLPEVDQKTLTPEQQIVWLRTTIDLLFNTGNARKAAEFVEQSIDTLERLGLHHRYLILSAGTQGNYDALRKALADYERSLARQATDTAQRLVTYGMNAPPIGSPPHSFVLFGLNWSAWANACEAVMPEYYNVKTLRGVVALEAGDTGDAYRILQSVLQESENLDGLSFSDRPIAERYVTFLKRYRKK
jgi:tetratricopeptide (TPR) repeat protein